MNIPQKILTVLMIIAFVLGTFVVAIGYEPPLTSFLAVWVPIGVVYVGLFFVFAPRRK
jgi:hypothetical protein